MGIYIKLQSDKNISTLLHWLIILTCFSYPITAVIIAILQVPSTNVNIVLKVVYLCLAIMVIFLIYLKSKIRIPKHILGGLVFFLIYGVRIVFDISILGVEVMGYSGPYVYAYFFGATLVPCVAISLASRHLDYKKITRYSFIAIILSNLLLFYFLLFMSDFGNFEKQLAARASIAIEASDKGPIINPITIGYYGSLLSLFCLNLGLVNFFKNKIINLLLYPLFLLGLSIVLLGASRGPLIGLLILSFLSIIIKLYNSKNKVISVSRFLIIIFTAYFSLHGYISDLIIKYDIFLFTRMQDFLASREAGYKEMRDYSIDSAFNDFLSSPIIGNQFVGTFDNFYPHNIFVEVLMATGIIGAIFFLHFLFNFLRSSFIVNFNGEYKLKIPFIFTCLMCFFISLTSGSIYANPELWILMTLAVLTVRVKTVTTYV